MVTTVPLLLNQPQVKRAPLPSAVPPRVPLTSGALVLPLERLSPFERVTDQFADYGLLLQDAVAIQPSNPSFIAQPQGVYLMPLGNQCRLRLVLQRRFATVELHLQGYRDFHIEGLNGEGQRVDVAIQHHRHQGRPRQAPIHRVRVETLQARQLKVSSGCAFLLGPIWLFPHQEDPG